MKALRLAVISGLLMLSSGANAQSVDGLLNKVKEKAREELEHKVDELIDSAANNQNRQDRQGEQQEPVTTSSEQSSDPFTDLLHSILADSSGVDNASARATLQTYIGTQLAKGVRQAAAYGSAGHVYFIKRNYDEAIYAYTRAALIEPKNAEWLNDLAAALEERDQSERAEQVLRQVLTLFPNLDAAIANLAAIEFKKGECDTALAYADRALRLSPSTGLYHYIRGKSLECKGRKKQAEDEYTLAWINGYAGSGREGEPGSGGGAGGGKSGSNAGSGSSSGSTASNAGLNSSTHSGAKGSTPPPPPGEFGAKPIPEEWVGHYEAEYVRGKRTRAKVYGTGLAQTTINEDILVCAKEFGMDIDRSGTITGKGKVMYVYLGAAANPAMSMAPSFAIAQLGNFTATLKDGYQIRDWSFHGRVDAKGVVELEGMPSEKMPFYNVGQWQEIAPWNPLPPPDRSPRGTVRLQLATEQKSKTPTIYVNREVDFNGDLSLTYQAYIKKSDQPISPDCQRIEPKKATCPASEYLKVKSSIGADGKMTVESSRDMKTGDISTSTKVSVGAEAEGVAGTVSVEGSGNVSFEGSAGMLVGSTQYNPSDGSYQMTLGIGVNSGTLLPGPNKISEKVELVYDSACGWGIKGTAGYAGMSTGAGVEGAIFFSKGL